MSWQNLSNEWRCSLKDYRCVWCNENIKKGSVHHVSTGKMDGDFQSNRYHKECWTAACDYFRSGEEEFSPGDFKRGSTQQNCNT